MSHERRFFPGTRAKLEARKLERTIRRNKENLPETGVYIYKNEVFAVMSDSLDGDNPEYWQKALYVNNERVCGIVYEDNILQWSAGDYTTNHEVLVAAIYKGKNESKPRVEVTGYILGDGVNVSVRCDFSELGDVAEKTVDYLRRNFQNKQDVSLIAQFKKKDGFYTRYVGPIQGYTN